MARSYKGSCFCGAVEISVEGDAAAAGYCHCSSCRSWSAAPVNKFSLWKTDTVTVQKGEEHIGTYDKTPKSYRKFCKICGGHIMTAHPHWDLIDVYTATIPDYPAQPQLHVNYAEAVLPMRDGLPKMKDLPKEMGGSGELLPE